MEKFRVHPNDDVIITVDADEIPHLVPHDSFSYKIPEKKHDSLCALSAAACLVKTINFEAQLTSFILEAVPLYDRVDSSYIPDQNKNYDFKDRDYYVYMVLAKFEANRLLNIVPFRCLDEGIAISYDRADDDEYKQMIVSCLDFGRLIYIGHMTHPENFKIFTKFFVKYTKEVGFRMLSEIDDDGGIIQD